jgi:hypothetical protein
VSFDPNDPEIEAMMEARARRQANDPRARARWVNTPAGKIPAGVRLEIRALLDAHTAQVTDQLAHANEALQMLARAVGEATVATRSLGQAANHT